MATTKNNSRKNESNNQSANALKFTTYTSAKSGKTIPVVYGFTDKEDERIAYIAQIGKDGTPSAVHGRYTCLPVGKGDERVPCVMWGANESWHEVAKLAAKTVSDLDALTQEAYDALCAKADAVYQERKADSEQQREERKAAKAEEKKVSPKAKKQPAKSSQPKAAASAKSAKPKKEVTTSASRPKASADSGVLYTEKEVEDVLRKAFGALATAMKWESKQFEPLIEAALNGAAKTKVKAA
ncbi:MAG: hypothetical protein IKX61_01280 [Prevotella sp.]|nr:hypothetical protein [Prevotella sp.]